MTEQKCNCLECRLRAALSEGGDPSAPFEVDVNEAAKAMGNILGELLAHHSSKAAKAFAIALLEHRKRWLKHPRVAAQQTPAGHA
ncbi:hypothetical protein [Bradyrhizobium sp. CCBAU 51753]|uniref:hypothetical protein n=1 Tax=Bradyrhizobium sp. CCBAU 51753 TaxID=1325100 RepID=UPI00188ACE25|nr:hypothetical protein [Bradyrhizobium sp. CCBAU 51753]QOZ25334.1 hypothetical protein XH93_18335 [Bradyrhizobium sp. CCBAU 51753]